MAGLGWIEGWREERRYHEPMERCGWRCGKLGTEVLEDGCVWRGGWAGWSKRDVIYRCEVWMGESFC